MFRWAIILGLAAVIWLLVWWLEPTLRRMRQFEAELKDRESVPDEELVSRYFDERATAANVPGEVRRVFAKHMGYPADKLFPDDDLTFFWAELDMVDLINELESVFEIRFCREELARTPCTIRAVAILVRKKLRSVGSPG